MFDGRWYCTVPRVRPHLSQINSSSQPALHLPVISNAQGASTSKNTVYRSGFDFHFKEGQPYTTSIPILGYDGPTDASQAYDGWCLDEKDELLPGFRTCCTITADLSELAKLTPTKTNADGGKYKTLCVSFSSFFLESVDLEADAYSGGCREYMICILPGGTALKAEVRWYLDVSATLPPSRVQKHKLTLVFPPGGKRESSTSDRPRSFRQRSTPPSRCDSSRRSGGHSCES